MYYTITACTCTCRRIVGIYLYSEGWPSMVSNDTVIVFDVNTESGRVHNCLAFNVYSPPSLSLPFSPPLSPSPSPPLSLSLPFSPSLSPSPSPPLSLSLPFSPSLSPSPSPPLPLFSLQLGFLSPFLVVSLVRMSVEVLMLLVAQRT